MKSCIMSLKRPLTLTNSKIGYLHFVNPDQKTIQLVTWSKETLNYCTADYATHYPLDQAGNLGRLRPYGKTRRP